MLRLAACVGTLTDVGTLTLLSLLSNQPEDVVHRALGSAVQEGLVLRTGGAYRFLHDRIQQAAYSLIAEDQRPTLQLAIGRSLLASRAAAGKPPLRHCKPLPPRHDGNHRRRRESANRTPFPGSRPQSEGIDGVPGCGHLSLRRRRSARRGELDFGARAHVRASLRAGRVSMAERRIRGRRAVPAGASVPFADDGRKVLRLRHSGPPAHDPRRAREGRCRRRPRGAANRRNRLGSSSVAPSR